MVIDKNVGTKEYELLRQEILHADRIVVLILGIVFSATGIMIGQALSSNNSYILLAPFPVLWVTSHYVADKRWVIWLIASYLRCNLESRGLGMKWETSLHALRRSGKKFIPLPNIIKVEFAVFNILGVLCAALFFVMRAQNPETDIPLWHGSFHALSSGGLLFSTASAFFPLIREGSKSTLDQHWTQIVSGG